MPFAHGNLVISETSQTVKTPTLTQTKGHKATARLALVLLNGSEDEEDCTEWLRSDLRANMEYSNMEPKVENRRFASFHRRIFRRQKEDCGLPAGTEKRTYIHFNVCRNNSIAAGVEIVQTRDFCRRAPK